MIPILCKLSKDLANVKKTWRQFEYMASFEKLSLFSLEDALWTLKYSDNDLP